MTETAETIKDTVEVLAPYLDKPADSIGNNGTYVFGLMVKQVYISGIMEIINSILWLGIGYAYYRIAIHAYRWAQREVPSEFGSGTTTWAHRNCDTAFGMSVVMTIIGIVMLCLMGAAVFALKDAVVMLMNPEYQAVIQLLHAIH